ncbi:chalcone isomerase family protein [Cupriavidus sp. IDO]|uniref:chalcone isomerase family protein n=1 Tax=Cupriavidus sp. IDO TaxID=1539142 RepID=UPI000AAAEA1E|nr:chalcone isomerase family protein [Cupriavidus sp. IDO]
MYADTAHRLRHQLATLCISVTLGALLPAAGASVIEGMRFDDAARVGGKELQLNGTGLRAGLVLKGYVAALYLPEKARNATVVLGTSGSKRLQLRMLRETDPVTFVKAMQKGMRQNHSELQLQMLSARLVQLEQTMDQVGTAHKGDVINIDFSPDSGTVVAINGTPRGRPIPGEDFYQAVLRIFLGDNPVDRDVKRGLLGG